ncbi:NAD(P)/FAD-dependent oxidoreductase [Pirellula sp. SH-Sr6A]|uniref:NAD(P)/FAD-dependent oxidoreductase n=1 Tax=Pirellula sp. SH-Sr6A TaxID=1632865 RepID=UPI00197CAB75|nr:FAD-dependent monooxygenase [Pirellula sp. SH-Sr6A]
METDWDCVVIGAGVAGLSFAIRAARGGHRVLILEAKTFPREKVCGGCLNRRAQGHLKELGILGRVMALGTPIEELVVDCQGTLSSWKVPTMLSIRRSTLDQVLAETAIAAGCEIRWNTRGTVVEAGESGPATVKLQKEGETRAATFVHAGMVAVAAGLTRSPIQKDPRWNQQISDRSRIGVHALCHLSDLHSQLGSCEWLRSLVAQRQLHMLVGKSGYLGICLSDDGYVDFAAAIDPDRIENRQCIGGTVDSILQDCQRDSLFGRLHTEWFATPPLTRSSAVVGIGRTFLVGDALGYVEPFTGEGMSWAFASAKRLAALFGSSQEEGWMQLAKHWNDWARQERSTKTWVATWVAAQARKPNRCKWILRGLDVFPPVRRFLVRKAMQ